MNVPTSQSRAQAIPPLPDILASSADEPVPAEPVAIEGLIPEFAELLREWRQQRLRLGCYLINFTPAGASKFLTYDGTLRIERQHAAYRASGDVYTRKVLLITKPPVKIGRPLLDIAPDPADGIPIFPRDQYVGYLRVTKCGWSSMKGIEIVALEFEAHSFDEASRSWTKVGTFAAGMRRMTAPAGYPSPGDYFEGNVTKRNGVVVGRLTMGWVSSYLRRAIVEIDRVSASEAPLNNGAGVGWRTVFDQVGWDITVHESDANVLELSGESWSDGELHQGMLAWRGAIDLDKQWRYHLLCVRRLDSTARGLMYDAYGGDSNNIPREGAAISSHWQIPNGSPWGDCGGLRFGQSAPAYFRTAVHEIGHAIMMFHPNTVAGTHIMQTTPEVAANAVPPDHFPHNIEWAFSAEDQRRLRHLPDVVVRPGTVVRFDTDVSPGYLGVPLADTATARGAGLTLHVSPVVDTVPIGAPVRVDFTVVNQGEVAVPFPADLGLKAGYVIGKVIDPSGVERLFAPIVRYLDGPGLSVLAPNESASDSLTLVRGPDGALFPSSGRHRVVVTVTWDIGGCIVQLTGETTVMVTAAVDAEHARTARTLLGTPDVLLTLAMPGDQHTEGNAAVREAMKQPVLRPHFAYIEARRLARRSGARAADVRSASALITQDTVLSSAEREKLPKIGVAAPLGAPVGV